MRTDKLRGQVCGIDGVGTALPMPGLHVLFATVRRLPAGMPMVSCAARFAACSLARPHDACTESSLAHLFPLVMMQAWIAFADIAAATSALRGMQGFPFFDKPVVRAAACLPPAWQPARSPLTDCHQRQCCTNGQQLCLVMLGDLS